MFLKNPYDIPPLLDAKVQAQANPHARGLQTTKEEAGSPLCRLRESQIIDLWVGLCLTDHKTFPVYFWLLFMHATTVCHH